VSTHALSSNEADALAALRERPAPLARELAKELAARGFPNRRSEAWKYSDLREAIRGLDTTILADWHKFFPFGPEPDGTELAPSEPDFQARWAAAMQSNATVYRVEPGQERTIELDVEAYAGFGHATTIIRVGEGGICRLRERYISEANSLGNHVLHLVLQQGAALDRIVIQDESDGAVILSTAYVSLAQQARLQQTILAQGAKLVRLETHVRHPGGGAEVRLDGLYVLGGSRHADLTSVVTHEGRDGATTELTKGVVRDRARGVFQGKIVVAEGADGTDARMGHHALLLSDRAEVDAKPELEIFADDVSCAHGNTVGALDEEAMFYAQSRGMPEDEARAMLIEAFLGEVVDRIEHEGAREACRAWVVRKLRGEA